MEEFAYDIASGNVPELKVLHKFGANTDIDTGSDPEDIWDGGGLWVAPTDARIHDIASSSAADAAAGTGARTVQVYGLTSWDTEEVSETITLNGTTNVPTTNSYVVIYRIVCRTFGSGATNAGDITATAQTDATVTAQVTAGEGQTLMAIYAVPRLRTAYLIDYYAAMNRNSNSGSADIELRVNERPDQSDSGFVTKHRIGLGAAGSSATEKTFDPPLRVDGPAILKLTVVNVSANNTDISGGMDGVVTKAY